MIFERVIYCAVSALALLGQAPYEVLSRRADGVVVAVSNHDGRELLEHNPELALLYFSRTAYLRAMQGLPDAEIDAAVLKRRLQFAPDVTGKGLRWVDQSARQALAWTALSRMSSPGPVLQRLDSHFEQVLELLVVIGGERRYQDVGIATLLSFVFEGEARLHSEFVDARNAAQHAGDAGAAQEFAASMARSEEFGREAGALLKALGRPEYDGALPRISASRGVFVSPADAQIAQAVRMQRDISVPLDGGVVVNWSADDLAALEQRGKSVHVLYWDGGELRVDAQELTTAQLTREFARRLDAGRTGAMLMRRDHLVSLWLEQHLLRRMALKQARDGSVVSVLERQVAQESQALRSALGLHPAWLQAADQPAADALESLRQCEQRLLQDAGLLAALARRSADTVGEALFTRIADFQPMTP